MAKTTPMMAQYERIKTAHPDKIVFFRLGDFYEMFRQDAVDASRILSLTLTQRNGIPMCGIPHHAAGNYLPKLLTAGKKVAICEQTRMPETPGAIADREVVEILTPGSVLEENFLQKGDHNYIASISRPIQGLRSGPQNEELISLSFVDISTGNILLSCESGESVKQSVLGHLGSYQPSELLVQESLLATEPWIKNEQQFERTTVLNRLPDWNYEERLGHNLLKAAMGLANLSAFGLTDSDPRLHSLGPLLGYLEENAGRPLRHIRSVEILGNSDYMNIDSSTQKNLELVKNLQNGGEELSLFGVIDQTRTSMGRRLLKKWILRPLLDVEKIRKRQSSVQDLYHDQLSLNKVRETLAGCLDLPRLAARISMEKAHPKDLLAVSRTLSLYFDLYALLKGGISSSYFDVSDLPVLQQLTRIISTAIHQDAPSIITDGGIFQSGYDDVIDECLQTEANAGELLSAYLQKEQNEHSLPGLKLKNNRLIGYFLELSKSQSGNVPQYFIRRQGLANAERFTTEELQQLADTIGNAEDRRKSREQELFIQLRGKLASELQRLQTAGESLARIDVLQSFAYQATLYGYTLPELMPGNGFEVVAGRHPVVERAMESERFNPNDLKIANSDPGFFQLITGPNMAGKSTFLRQNAIIALLAQIGSFVPAEEARLGICDRLFCRVGASDNLARGESTFLVEMNETAFILRQATAKSFVIMDEVGRGTGTQDGLSIAWAVCEYLLGHIRCRTLFATHFHELSDLEHPSMRNLSLAVREDRGSIQFLNKVEEGPSNNSYGIHVAQIAGIPDEIIFRAGDILELIQRGESIGKTRTDFGQNRQLLPAASRQRGLFGNDELVLHEIMDLDINSLSPLEALNTLHRMQTSLKN